MLISVTAAVLLVFTIIDPFALPLYATTDVKIGLFEIKVGPDVEKFLQIPWLAGLAVSTLLLLVAIYMELYAKIAIGNLPKALAILSLLYAVPLPYVYLVDFKDIVVVLSNYAKFLSLPIFSLALIVAISERLLTPQRRTKVIADLSVTEERTERGQ